MPDSKLENFVIKLCLIIKSFSDCDLHAMTCQKTNTRGDCCQET